MDHARRHSLFARAPLSSGTSAPGSTARNLRRAAVRGANCACAGLPPGAGWRHNEARAGADSYWVSGAWVRAARRAPVRVGCQLQRVEHGDLSSMCLLPLRTVGRCDARRLLPSESSSDSAGGDAVPDDAGLRAECGASLTVGEHDTKTEGPTWRGPWQAVADDGRMD